MSSGFVVKGVSRDLRCEEVCVRLFQYPEFQCKATYSNTTRLFYTG